MENENKKNIFNQMIQNCFLPVHRKKTKNICSGIHLLIINSFLIKNGLKTRIPCFQFIFIEIEKTFILEHIRDKVIPSSTQQTSNE